MSEPQVEPKLKPLPCPFCGKPPKLIPSNPKLDGNAWAAVVCVNLRGCPASPRVEDGADACDERGSGAYKDAAIRRWNRRPLEGTGSSSAGRDATDQHDAPGQEP